MSSWERGGTALLAALAWLLSVALLPAAPPDLRPVMPEVDGVHPARAAQAFGQAYAPGQGFLDKYPPLGSFLMGAVVRASDPLLAGRIQGLADQPPEVRARELWQQREPLGRVLAAQRWVSRLALAAAVGLVAWLTAELLDRLGLAGRGRSLAALVAALGFGLTYPALYYGATTNVDALALALSLAVLALALRRRWAGAAASLALALAVKDPAYVLAPVVLLAVLADRGVGGRARRALRFVAVLLAVYALASGALTGFGVWEQHVRYLFGGGVATVAAIDVTEPGEWLGLLVRCGRLLAGALGLVGVFAGLLGLALVARRERRSGDLLASELCFGALVATLGFFVLPVGFVYVRFLLVPLALLAAGAGVALAAAVAQAGDGRGRLRLAALLIGLVCVPRDAELAGWRLWPALDYHERILGRPDPRRLAAEALASWLPERASVLVVADAREHGPPLDAERFDVEVVGLEEGAVRLSSWAAGDVADVPEALLILSFPNDPPSGRPGEAPLVLRAGDRVAGVFRVEEVFGLPERGAAERELAVRPMVSVLLRAAPPDGERASPELRAPVEGGGGR